MLNSLNKQARIFCACCLKWRWIRSGGSQPAAQTLLADGGDSPLGRWWPVQQIAVSRPRSRARSSAVMKITRWCSDWQRGRDNHLTSLRPLSGHRLRVSWPGPPPQVAAPEHFLPWWCGHGRWATLQNGAWTVCCATRCASCVFRCKSARHSDFMSAIDSDAKSATGSDLMSVTPSGGGRCPAPGQVTGRPYRQGERGDRCQPRECRCVCGAS